MKKIWVFFILIGSICHGQLQVEKKPKGIKAECKEISNTIQATDSKIPFKPEFNTKPKRPLVLIYDLTPEKSSITSIGGDTVLIPVSSFHRSFYYIEKTEIDVSIFHAIHILDDGSGYSTMQRSHSLKNTVFTSIVHLKCTFKPKD